MKCQHFSQDLTLRPQHNSQSSVLTNIQIVMRQVLSKPLLSVLEQHAQMTTRCHRGDGCRKPRHDTRHLIQLFYCFTKPCSDHQWNIHNRRNSPNTRQLTQETQALYIHTRLTRHSRMQWWIINQQRLMAGVVWIAVQLMRRLSSGGA